MLLSAPDGTKEGDELRQEAHFSYHENTTPFIMETQAAWLGRQHSAQPDQLQQPAQLQQSMDSIAGAVNPYRLMQVFGRGHQVTRNMATVYVTRCQVTEVLLRTHTTALMRFW
jgi:hypothetical protein